MRYMMFMRVDPAVYDRDTAGEPEVYAAMGRYNEELNKAGVLLALDGLQSPALGERIEFGAGGATVVDGPFAEAKELVCGIAIMRAADKREAIELAKVGSALRNGYGETEARLLFEAEDFADAMQ
jgi:hypothetical protein